MAHSAFRFEEAALRDLVPKLESDGFSVFLHPAGDLLPEFLQQIRPDAVAYKGDRKIAFELSTKRSTAARTTQQAFRDHPDWELRLIYASPLEDEPTIPPVAAEIIESSLQRIEALGDAIGEAGTLLLAWSAFEAAVRRLASSESQGVQSTRQLIEGFASEGEFTPDEADKLRAIYLNRNRIAHGSLDLAVAPPDVEFLIRTTRALLTLQR